MDVLATRSLSSTDKDGTKKELILTVFMPFEAKEDLWRCGFATDPPINKKIVYGGGIDFIQAFVECLKVARIYFETSAKACQAHWQEMPDCGLPWRAERPASLGHADIPPPESNAGTVDVLTTRRLGYPGESGGETELLLTVFVPFKTESAMWKCGFTFGTPANAPIRYGVGADCIEALLDGLAMARVAFEGMIPKGWDSSSDLLDCADLPYKIGRSFWTDLASSRPSVETDSSTG